MNSTNIYNTYGFSYPIGNSGPQNRKQTYLPQLPPVHVSYETAAVPRCAPYGTDYTPDYRTKIIGSRYVTVPDSATYSSQYQLPLLAKPIDPDIAPTKSIQNVHAKDYSHWPPQTKPRFDTTYRAEYINRIRHPDYAPWYLQGVSDQIAKPIRNTQSSFNSYTILPPINPNPVNRNNDVPNNNSSSSTYGSITELQPPKQSLPSNENISRDVPPMNMNNRPQTFYDQPPMLPPPPPPPVPTVSVSMPQQAMMYNEADIYLPAEPVLLTDYEEQRLAEQVAYQLGYPSGVEKLKLFYQELTAYDPNLTHYVHYSNIQLLAAQLGLGLQDDTLRFAMCKFVTPNQSRGFVNYEEMIRYLSKCLTYTNPNQYNPQRSLSQRRESINTSVTDQFANSQVQYPIRNRSSLSGLTEDFEKGFDPDERQVRLLLKQNLKYFDTYESIDFDKLYREFQNTDRNQTGVLNRQQIEEVVYKIRIPLQRSLIFQILEKHCRAYLRLYKWETFYRYLKETILEIESGYDGASSTVLHVVPTRNQWLDLLRREYRENDRLKVIERFINAHEGTPLESHDPSAWFARFLRLANAMYSHRASTNINQDFLLPREEVRRLFRAYNQIYDLRVGENKLELILDTCARGGNTDVDTALKLLAK